LVALRCLLALLSVGLLAWFVKFEAFTAVTMKKAVFWDLAPCICGVNRRFGERIATIFREEEKV
jgi:hypothetical protein